MITVEIDNLIKDLEKYHDDMVFRLEQMVRTFSYNVALTAIQKTPIGDYASGTKRYKAYYDARQPPLPKWEGLAKGNWQYYRQGLGHLQIISGQAAGETALDIFESDAMAYRLGQTFYIGNNVPYAEDLEADSSPQTNGEGIGRPTMQVVTSLYQFSLPQYYKEAKGAV